MPPECCASRLSIRPCTRDSARKSVVTLRFRFQLLTLVREVQGKEELFGPGAADGHVLTECCPFSGQNTSHESAGSRHGSSKHCVGELHGHGFVESRLPPSLFLMTSSRFFLRRHLAIASVPTQVEEKAKCSSQRVVWENRSMQHLTRACWHCLAKMLWASIFHYSGCHLPLTMKGQVLVVQGLRSSLTSENKS